MHDTTTSCGVPDKSPKHDCFAERGLCKMNRYGKCHWYKNKC